MSIAWTVIVHPLCNRGMKEPERNKSEKEASEC